MQQSTLFLRGETTRAPAYPLRQRGDLGCADTWRCDATDAWLMVGLTGLGTDEHGSGR